MKLVYKGDLPEVELLATGKRFKKGVPLEVSKEEAEMLRNHADFMTVKPKKKA